MGGAALLAVVAALAQPAAIRLTVTVDAGRDAPVQTARLACWSSHGKATGYLRTVGSQRTCGTARRRAFALTHAPDEQHRVCSQIFGGPEKARVTGRIGTRPVDRRLARTDGCQIAEWDALVPLVPAHRTEGLGRAWTG